MLAKRKASDTCEPIAGALVHTQDVRTQTQTRPPARTVYIHNGDPHDGRETRKNGDKSDNRKPKAKKRQQKQKQETKLKTKQTKRQFSGALHITCLLYTSPSPRD